MGISIEYYFNAPLPLPELAEQLNAPLGSRLSPFDGRDEHIGRTVALQTSLDHNTFDEDDEDLTFGRYQYELSLHTSGSGAMFRSIQLPVMLSMVRVLQELWGYEGMLVYDVDVLLAQYEPGTFVDTLSGTSLDDFPAHLTAVWSRLPPTHDLTPPRRQTS